MSKAIFMDRDGVVNVDHGYVCMPREFEFIAGAVEGMRELSRRGYALVIVTNQSGIGRGLFSESDFLSLNRWMTGRLEDAGVSIDEVRYCPHLPDAGCSCRKPEPGMILEAGRKLAIDLEVSCMVGDKDADMQAACAAGIPVRILLGDAPSAHHTHRAGDWEQVLAIVP